MIQPAVVQSSSTIPIQAEPSILLDHHGRRLQERIQGARNLGEPNRGAVSRLKGQLNLFPGKSPGKPGFGRRMAEKRAVAFSVSMPVLQATQNLKSRVRNPAQL